MIRESLKGGSSCVMQLFYSRVGLFSPENILYKTDLCHAPCFGVYTRWCMLDDTCVIVYIHLKACVNCACSSQTALSGHGITSFPTIRPGIVCFECEWRMPKSDWLCAYAGMYSHAAMQRLSLRNKQIFEGFSAFLLISLQKRVVRLI